MIGYLRGVVSHVFSDYCFIDVGGVGYRVFISGTAKQKIALGEEAMFFTHLNVREDAMLLFGFYSKEEYETFLVLVAVNGVGPKLAMSVLSCLNVRELYAAIQSKNIVKLLTVPGVGKKMAERLVLELKDKMQNMVFLEGETVNADGAFADNAGDNINIRFDGAVEEALIALVGLGYQKAEIVKVLARLEVAEQDVGTIIKKVLQEIGKSAYKRNN